MKMTETKSTEEGLDGLVQQTFRLFELIPYSVLALGARFAVALFFFRSALTRVGEKIDLGFMSIPLPWVIGEHQDLVFSEYKYFGFEMPEWFHAVSVHPIVWAESVFPLLLMVGLASRYAAAVLCVMALTIGLVVYDESSSPRRRSAIRRARGHDRQGRPGQDRAGCADPADALGEQLIRRPSIRPRGPTRDEDLGFPSTSTTLTLTLSSPG